MPEDAAMNVRFVILTAGRSGSSLIGDALRSHPSVLSFGELFEDELTRDDLNDKGIRLRKKKPDEAHQDYLSKTVFIPHPGDYQAIGMRVKYYNFEGNDLMSCFCNSDIKIIHSRRENIVAQSVSLPLAEKHDFGCWKGAPKKTGLYTKAITVDIAGVIYRAESNESEAAYFDAAFKPLLPVFDAYYHEFCGTDSSGKLRNKKLVGKLLRFLNIEPRTLITHMLKQRRKPYQELIKNYTELRQEALRVHPEWQRHFEAMESGALCT